MKATIQKILIAYRPVVTHVGQSGNGQCYHVKFQPNASEADIYAAKDEVTKAGLLCLCYHTEHNGLAQLGVFTAN